jgi:hypothetical protein
MVIIHGDFARGKRILIPIPYSLFPTPQNPQKKSRNNRPAFLKLIYFLMAIS